MEKQEKDEKISSTKIKPRPPKLKNPLDSVLQGEIDFTSTHRPIGTPPPASLRRSRQSFDLGSNISSSCSFSSTSSSTSPTSECFPRINVVNSPESDTSSCTNSTAFPALNDITTQQEQEVAPSNTKRSLIDNQRRSMSVDNNNPIDGGSSSPKGLTPPQRLMTRDQDGVVFELTGGRNQPPS